MEEEEEAGFMAPQCDTVITDGLRAQLTAGFRTVRHGAYVWRSTSTPQGQTSGLSGPLQ